MQIGDTIRVRFLTMPEPFPGAGATKDNLYPVRKATVVYVHPKGRYIVAGARAFVRRFSRKMLYSAICRGLLRWSMI